MLYNYLITVYKVIVGLVTSERLIAVALGAFGLYLIWITCSLIASFQRKFNSRCQVVINDVLKTKDIENHPELLDKKIDKISSGFSFGWKKFRKSPVGKPSDYIKRHDAIDVEINGGVLNNGKTMMRAYITFVTAILFIFNFAYVGGENAITFISFAEATILPFVFYVIVKLFYFLHSSIKQKLYRMDIESFYELVDLLDTKFAKKGKLIEEEEVEEEPINEETNEEQEETKEEPEEEVQEETGLDKYDVFKKKNIDVSKIMNEVPQHDSSLPHINVDSDYVIKDEEEVGAKVVGQDDNASTIFGGMMQNTSGLKKNNFVDIEKNIAEIDEEKLEKINSENNVEDVNSNIGNAEENSAETSFKEDDILDGNVTLGSLLGNVKEEEPEPLELEPEEPAPASTNSSKFIEIEKNEENSENQEQESIANVVSGFKASRSKLASGGMVIERNEPIAKRERVGTLTNEREEPNRVEQPSSSYVEPVRPEPEDVINRPEVNSNADDVLNTLKSVQGNYDGYATGQNYAPSTNYAGMAYEQNYGYQNPMQPVYGQMNGAVQGYPYVTEPVYPNYAGTNYAPNYNETPTGQFDEQDVDFEEVEELPQVEEEQTKVVKPKKQKVVKSKDEEPRPRNLKSSAKKEEKREDTPMAKRGRPKKQEVSESMVIENDEQFNEILSRAEKLMRKSEEGLSESQSKRIEKEIKILMDAMNRYKEGK